MRIAVLDLGTNTFHCIIYSVEPNHPPVKLFKSKKVVKLGENGITKGIISEIPFHRGLNALKGYKKVIDQYQAEKVFAFATSAIRGASNGKDFVAAVHNETGIEIKIISGEEEAELICNGVRNCLNFTDRSLIMDIGGGSTEFIIADRKTIFWKYSFNIGAARLLELFNPSDPISVSEQKKITDFLTNELQPLWTAVSAFPVKCLIGSSGSFDTFAELILASHHKATKGIPGNSFHFNMNDFFTLADKLIPSTKDERLRMKGLIKMRVDMIVLATICTLLVVNKCNISDMYLSKFALKEGALFKIVEELNNNHNA